MTFPRSLEPPRTALRSRQRSPSAQVYGHSAQSLPCLPPPRRGCKEQEKQKGEQKLAGGKRNDAGPVSPPALDRPARGAGRWLPAGPAAGPRQALQVRGADAADADLFSFLLFSHLP